MKEKTYTLNIRQAGTYQYEVTIPEIGATKTAPTLDSALSITLHDILKHFNARYLILSFADQYFDREGESADLQECLQTDLEHEAILGIARLDISQQVKRRERHLVFKLSCPLTREQVTWLNEHAGKLFDQYSIKDELEVENDAMREEVRDNRKAANHE
jgi:hypothetical protein